MKVNVDLDGAHSLRGIEAEVCAKCGERYYGPEAMDRIEAAYRGLPGKARRRRA